MKQIDWTGGKIPPEAVEGGCRVVQTAADMDTIPESEQHAGMLVYVTDTHTMYALVEDEETKSKSFETANSVESAMNEEVIKMFVDATGENPKIDLGRSEEVKLEDGTMASEATAGEIRSMFPEEANK